MEKVELLLLLVLLFFTHRPVRPAVTAPRSEFEKMVVDSKSIQRFSVIGLDPDAHKRLASWDKTDAAICSGQLMAVSGVSTKDFYEQTLGSSNEVDYPLDLVEEWQELFQLQRDLAAFCRGEHPGFSGASNWSSDWKELRAKTKQELLNASSILTADIDDLENDRQFCGDYLQKQSLRLLKPGGFEELVRLVTNNVTTTSTDGSAVIVEPSQEISVMMGLPDLTEEFRRLKPFVASNLDNIIIRRSLFLTLVVWNILCAMYGNKNTFKSKATDDIISSSSSASMQFSSAPLGGVEEVPISSSTNKKKKAKKNKKVAATAATTTASVVVEATEATSVAVAPGVVSSAAVEPPHKLHGSLSSNGLDLKSVQRFAATGLGTAARERISKWDRMDSVILSGNFISYLGGSMRERLAQSIANLPDKAIDFVNNHGEEDDVNSKQLLDLQHDIASFTSGYYPDFSEGANWLVDWTSIPVQTKQALLNASMIKVADAGELEDDRQFCADYLNNKAERLLRPGGFEALLSLVLNVTPGSKHPVLIDPSPAISVALGLPLTDKWRQENKVLAPMMDTFLVRRSLFLCLMVWYVLCAMYGKNEECVSSQTAENATMENRLRKKLGDDFLDGENDFAKAVRDLKFGQFGQEELRCSHCGSTRGEIKLRDHGGSLSACAGCSTHQADSLLSSPVMYCSRECQKAHWKIHKPDCGKTRAAITRYEDGSARSPALAKQVRSLELKEHEGVDYLLFTGDDDSSDVGIMFQHTAVRVMFTILKRRVFASRNVRGEVRRMYVLLKGMLPMLSGRVTDADLRRQLKAEYGFDDLEAKG